MEVPLSPDVTAKLTRLAAARGRDAKLLAQEAIESYVDYEDWFIREVEKGQTQIEQGKTLSHSEVGKRVERLVADKLSRV